MVFKLARALTMTPPTNLLLTRTLSEIAISSTDPKLVSMLWPVLGIPIQRFSATLAEMRSVDPDIAAAVVCGTIHAARTERLFRGPARSLSLQQRDWLRPGRRSWPCCRARLRLSPAREALIA